jgi:hypothetical protein
VLSDVEGGYTCALKPSDLLGSRFCVRQAISMIFLVENETDDVALLLNVEPRWPTLGYVQTQKKLRTAPQEEDWTKR